MIILDTNVLSALMRPIVNEPVVEWVNRQPAALLWTTAVSLMEIRVGLCLMAAGGRRDSLTDGFNILLGGLLKNRVLPFDTQAAEAASRIAALQKQRGFNIEIGHHQIAGIVMSREASLATRNVKDFAGLEFPVINPWQQ
jgi:predicted nucleic acid-binding protein